MALEVWMVEQQAIDRECWAAEKAREEERAKALEEKLEIAMDMIVDSTGLSESEILQLKSE